MFLVHENVLFTVNEPDRGTIFDNQINYRFVCIFIVSILPHKASL